MRQSQRLQPGTECFQEFARFAGVAHRLRGQRLYGRKRVLDPVVQLAQQNALPDLAGLGFADVVIDAEDEGRATVGIALDDPATGRDPAHRIGMADPVFAGELVAFAEIGPEPALDLANVAPVDGRKDAPGGEPRRWRQVKKLLHQGIAFDEI